MKKIAVIPARYASQRFPAKLMQQLGNKTVIRHTYDNTVATGLFDDVFVATDSDEIFQEIVSNGGKAIRTSTLHQSGSDRIAEAVKDMDVDVILNVQGDEPFVDTIALQSLLSVFEQDVNKEVEVGSLMRKFDHLEDIENENNVKVVVDLNHNSLLFSRSVIPFHRDKDVFVKYFHHIGIYAFRKTALLNFTKWEMTPLEKAEKIECLRYLEHGIPLRMVEITQMGIGIDTPADLEKARLRLSEKN